MSSTKACDTVLPIIRGISYYSCEADSLPYRFDQEFSLECHKFLQENGFVVIANVINKQQINHAFELFWKWLKNANFGWQRSDIKTWTNETFPGYLKTGIMYKYGLGQSELQWYLRTRPSVLETFTKLWNVPSFRYLLTSFDGCGIFRSNFKTRNQWFHVDQHFDEYPDFNVYQSLISMIDQNETTGGTVVIPKSHLVFEEATADIKGGFKRLATNHWILSSAENKNGNGSIRYPKLLISLKAGDLLIWDGRTIHCNTPPLIIDGNDKHLTRFVSYIAMSPKMKVAKKEWKEYVRYRLNAYSNGITTGHWPHKSNIVDIPDIGMNMEFIGNSDSMIDRETVESLVGFMTDFDENSNLCSTKSNDRLKGIIFGISIVTITYLLFRNYRKRN